MQECLTWAPLRKLNIQFHYALPRRISMREAARIQSFPDNFRFMSKLRETEQQIGNAVPPVLAWHIANAVKSLMGRDAV
jgi:DNA (cytosine-5)-methyltransferase 1